MEGQGRTDDVFLTPREHALAADRLLAQVDELSPEDAATPQYIGQAQAHALTALALAGTQSGYMGIDVSIPDGSAPGIEARS